MSRGRQKISFEGLLQENVLGTFTVIRGFADLRYLRNQTQIQTSINNRLSLRKIIRECRWSHDIRYLGSRPTTPVRLPL